MNSIFEELAQKTQEAGKLAFNEVTSLTDPTEITPREMFEIGFARGCKNPLEVEISNENVNEFYNAALNFALDEAGEDAVNFLSLWREGAWSDILKEYPKFNNGVLITQST